MGRALLVYAEQLSIDPQEYKVYLKEREETLLDQLQKDHGAGSR